MINIRKINTNILKAFARWLSTTALMVLALIGFSEPEINIFVWMGIVALYLIAVYPKYDDGIEL